MNPKTLQNTLQNKRLSQEASREARTVGAEAREERRVFIDELNQSTQMNVAKAAGVVITPYCT